MYLAFIVALFLALTLLAISAGREEPGRERLVPVRYGVHPCEMMGCDGLGS